MKGRVSVSRTMPARCRENHEALVRPAAMFRTRRARSSCEIPTTASSESVSPGSIGRWVPFASAFSRAVALMRQLRIGGVLPFEQLRLHAWCDSLVCAVLGFAGGRPNEQCLRSLSLSPYMTVLALISTDATARANHKQQHARKTHDAKEARPITTLRLENVGTHGMPTHNRIEAVKRMRRLARGHSCLSGDLALVKEAIDLARKAKTDEATATRNRMADPAAQKLVECYPAPLGNNGEFQPVCGVHRRTRNGPAWRCCAGGQRRGCAGAQRCGHGSRLYGDGPLSAKGNFALARVLLTEGDREARGPDGRRAWRSDELSERLEAEAYETFRDLLNPRDHRARMDMRIGAKDLAGAKRAAQRLGGDELAIVKACARSGEKRTRH